MQPHPYPLEPRAAAATPAGYSAGPDAAERPCDRLTLVFRGPSFRPILFTEKANTLHQVDLPVALTGLQLGDSRHFSTAAGGAPCLCARALPSAPWSVANRGAVLAVPSPASLHLCSPWLDRRWRSRETPPISETGALGGRWGSRKGKLELRPVRTVTTNVAAP